MPFYTGSANSFSELQTALVNACVAEGWTHDTGVLSKGGVHVKLTVSTVDTTGTGIGLLIQGGTSSSGGVLTNPSGQNPRMGAPSRSISLATFPMVYNIHIGTSPDEVYMIAKYNVDYHLFLAFGMSDVLNPVPPATGMWITATCHKTRGNTGEAVVISATIGGKNGIDHTSYTFAAHSAAPFWNEGSYGAPVNMQDAVCSGLETLWPYKTSNAATVGRLHAMLEATVSIQRQPNNWNSESVLIPIQVFEIRPSNRKSLVVDLKHARYIRVDNYLSGDIITLGSDKWMVYPFYKKDTTARNGGTPVDHTGTFGWAIRYDGP